MHRCIFSRELKEFNRKLTITARLPDGISTMNPYRDHAHALAWSDAFYDRFYSDSNTRRLILGINPGRLGAGQTGVPFTDTKRLFDYFGLGSTDDLTHESSSAYLYRVIDAFGGVDVFYSQFLVSSICPLGFVVAKNGKQVNYNYYDNDALRQAVTPFIVECMEKQLGWPIDRSVVYCLGTGQNVRFLQGLNKEHSWFERIEALAHPRYIMQYKSSEMNVFIRKYLSVLSVV